MGALQRPGTAFLLRHLWQRCAAGPGRPGLLEYLAELDAQFGPVLVETRADERSFEAEELRAPSVRAAATALYEGGEEIMEYIRRRIESPMPHLVPVPCQRLTFLLEPPQLPAGQITKNGHAAKKGSKIQRSDHVE